MAPPKRPGYVDTTGPRAYAPTKKELAVDAILRQRTRIRFHRHADQQGWPEQDRAQVLRMLGLDTTEGEDEALAPYLSNEEPVDV